MATKVAINGFGRIGRLVARAILSRTDHDLELVSINDLGDANANALLFKRDSVHGNWAGDVSVDGDFLVVDGKKIKVTAERDPANLPHAELGVEIALECTGIFTSKDKASAHLTAGAKRVVISAPTKSPEQVPTIVMGVNENVFDASKHNVVSNASCTTNCLAPVVKVIQETFGIRHGSMTTVHDITNTQTIIDAPHKDLRRARSCGTSLIPTTTGSATAITEIFPELKGRLNGHAVRVPLTNASLTDCVFEVERATTADEVNRLLKEAADGELNGILGYEQRPLVSIDYKGDPRSSIVDALSTMVVNNTQVKIYAWYDNEWGYANRTAELVLLVGRQDSE